MQDAFGSAGIPWDNCDREDRGDGVFVLVPAEVPKALLAKSLPPALVTALRAHNDGHPGPERIRLRMALHAGEVHYDQHGVTAVAVNLAFRLVDADPLKAALTSSSGVLAVIVSSWFFEEVVRHGGAAPGYRPVEVAVKETTTTGWICLPDQLVPAGWSGQVDQQATRQEVRRSLADIESLLSLLPGRQPADIALSLSNAYRAVLGRPILAEEQTLTVGWPGASQPRAPTESVRNGLPLYGSCRPGHLAAGFAQAQCAKYRGRVAAASAMDRVAFFQVRSFLYLFMIHPIR